MSLDKLLLGYTLNDPVTPLITTAMICITLPSAAVTARRLHDIGWSGRFQLPSYAVYSSYLSAWFPDFSFSTIGIAMMGGGMLAWLILYIVAIKDSKSISNKYWTKIFQYFS